MFKVIKTSDVLRRMQEKDLREFVSKVKAFEMKLFKRLKSCVLSGVLSDSKDADNGKQTAAALSQRKGNSQESEVRIRECGRGQSTLSKGQGECELTCPSSGLFGNCFCIQKSSRY